MKRKNDESRLQIAVVSWFRMQYPNLILLAIGNGGKRSLVTASIMKKEGVLAGSPDLLLAKRSKMGYGALFIEMKTIKGVLSPAQKALHPKLIDAGYCVAICRTFEEFKSTIEKYLA